VNGDLKRVFFKGIVYPKIQIPPPFTHPHAIRLSFIFKTNEDLFDEI